MNEYAKKLVAALRSGEYKQAPFILRDGGRFCCLGVACDLVKNEIGAKWEKNKYGEDVFLGEVAALPEKVRKIYGFKSHDGEFCNGALANLNDEGKAFEEIADVIESEPEGLFL